MTQNFDNLQSIARKYCDIIESVNDHNAAWLRDLFHLLPQLHAAITVFLEQGGNHGEHPEANLEVRFSLFSKLHQLLGEKDAYWMEYDLGHDECRSGSLADDLTDIYCELKQGLKLLDEEQADPDKVLITWREGYHIHWGRHLVDAERHLYELSARGAL